MNCQTLTRRSCRTRQASISSRGMRGRNQRAIKSLGSSAGVRWWLGVPKRTPLGRGAKGSGGNSSGSLNPRPNPEERATKYRGTVGWGGGEIGIHKVVASSAVSEPPKPDSGIRGPLRCAVAESPQNIRGGSQEAGEPWRAGTREREAWRLAYTETPAPAKRSLFWQFRSPSHRFTCEPVCERVRSRARACA